MAVSNFLNFSRAAEQLRITQPAVSHQINTLEDELGVKLFYRTLPRRGICSPSTPGRFCPCPACPRPG